MTSPQRYAVLVGLLGSTYRATTVAVDTLDDADFERRTRTEAWTVRQLLFHQLLDAQRALLVFATPDPGPADTDAVSYWSAWAPGGPDADAHARFVQRASDAYAGPRGLRAQWRDTSEAVLRAAAAHIGSGCLATQGHVLDVSAFVHTLAVEGAVHHLDLTLEIPSPGLPDAALDLVDEVLTGLLGEPLPSRWSRREAVLKGTGRSPLDDVDRGELGPSADRFPLFG